VADLRQFRLDELPGMRNQKTWGLIRWFEYGHLPEDLWPICQGFAELVFATVDRLPDGPELTACLRKLLEAKDCAVRAAIAARPT
jgi:hypothetical protein